MGRGSGEGHKGHVLTQPDGLVAPSALLPRDRSIKVKINITYITIIKLKIKNRFIHALRSTRLVEMDNK